MITFTRPQSASPNQEPSTTPSTDTTLENLSIPFSEVSPEPSSYPEYCYSSVAEKYAGVITTIGDTTIQYSFNDQDNRMTITMQGPTSPEERFQVFRPSTWRANPQSVITATFQVGSTECPDWNAANNIAWGTKVLVQMNEGYLGTTITEAISAHFPEAITS
jgi:hypothetical protein